MDMLKDNAAAYVQLGEEITDARVIFELDENFNITSLARGERRLNKRGQEDLAGELQKLLELAKKLDLRVSTALLEKRLNNLDALPQTESEFGLLVETLEAELKVQLFLFVPAERAKYYNMAFPSTITTAFPNASRELLHSGNCFALGEWTASVFHAMRAVELGLHAMAHSLEVAFPFPLELAEWGKIMMEIEPKIEMIRARPRSIERDEDLQFFSEAASQFRHFNSGWRVRTAHARAIYEEREALKAFDHTLSFFETLSKRLKEKSWSS